MPITLQCSCGKSLEVEDAHRGKKARCPACGNVLLAEEATAVQVAAPKPRPDIGKDAGESPARPVAKRRLMPWLAAGGCGFVALFSCFLCGGGAGVWFLFFNNSEPDLAFVHDGATGFITFRVADIRKNPAVKDQLNRLPGNDKDILDKNLADLAKKVGLTPDDLERVTLILPPDERMQTDLAIAVRTLKPIERKKLLDNAVGEKSTRPHRNTEYVVLTNQNALTLLHFSGDRVLLMAFDEEVMRNCLDKPTTHATLLRGVKLAGAGKHEFVAAFKHPVGNQPFPARTNLATLSGEQGMIVTARLAGQVELETIIPYATRDNAARAKTSIGDLRAPALQKMPQGADGPARMMRKLVDSAIIEQRGTDVVVAGKTDFDPLHLLSLANPVLGAWQAEQLGIRLEFEFGVGGAGRIKIDVPAGLVIAPPQKNANKVVHFKYKLTPGNPMTMDFEQTKVEPPDMFAQPQQVPVRLNVKQDGDRMTLVPVEPKFGANDVLTLKRVGIGGIGRFFDANPPGPAPKPAPTAAQIQGVNNLKQIVLAIHMFHDANKRLPSQSTAHVQTQQSLLSWRVTILPYVDQMALYNAIRHDEPWDSPHNRQFWNQMPKVFQLPGKPNDGKTHYQVFSGKETAFFDRNKVRIADIFDGTSNTIFVVEAAEPVNWMKPDDIPFRVDDIDLIKRVGNHWGNDTFQAALGDGTVRRMRRAMRPQTLIALITRAGGEIIDDLDWQP